MSNEPQRKQNQNEVFLARRIFALRMKEVKHLGCDDGFLRRVREEVAVSLMAAEEFESAAHMFLENDYQ